jgi:Protein of unknown function (DUF2892)
LIFNPQGFFMTNNIGGTERILRVVAGLVLVLLAVTGQVGIWAWVGLLPMATGLIGWCPPYSLLGINTCKNRKV